MKTVDGFDFSDLWLLSEKHNNIVASGQYVKVTNVLHNENKSSVFFEIDLCGSNPVYIDAKDIGTDRLFMVVRSDTDPSGWKAQLSRIERELNAQAPNLGSN